MYAESSSGGMLARLWRPIHRLGSCVSFGFWLLVSDSGAVGQAIGVGSGLGCPIMRHHMAHPLARFTLSAGCPSFPTASLRDICRNPAVHRIGSTLTWPYRHKHIASHILMAVDGERDRYDPWHSAIPARVVAHRGCRLVDLGFIDRSGRFSAGGAAGSGASG